MESTNELISLITSFLGLSEEEIDNLNFTRSSLTKGREKVYLPQNMELIVYLLNGTTSYFQIFIDKDFNQTSAIKLYGFNISSLYKEISEYKLEGIICDYSSGFFIPDDTFGKLLVEKVYTDTAPPSIMISVP